MKNLRGLLPALLFICCLQAAAEPFPWQKDYAHVDPRGDLAWKPEPYVFEQEQSLRCIDCEDGDGPADGRSITTAWKQQH